MNISNANTIRQNHVHEMFSWVKLNEKGSDRIRLVAKHKSKEYMYQVLPSYLKLS